MSAGLAGPAAAGPYLLTPDPLDEAFFGFGGAMMNDVFNPFGGCEPPGFLSSPQVAFNI